MMASRLIRGLVLPACILASMAGCGGKTETTAIPEGKDWGEPVDGDWLVSNLPVEMESLNPFTTSDAYASDINSYIFETLLDRDNETLELKPRLAERWEISDDKLTYTFYLRKDVVFSDGTPMTAHDVKFSFDKLMDPTTDAPHARNYYQDVLSCELVNDYTVRYTCSSPYFKHLTILGGLEVIPKHIYSIGNFNQHPNNRNPIGTGPYVLERWDTAQQIVMTRNEQYWGPKPRLSRRVFKIITDENAALQVLRQHEIDVLELKPEQWIRQASEPDFEKEFYKYKYFLPDFNYVGWNMDRPLFADKRVRQAMTMLLDRELILKEVYHGLGRITTGTFYVEEPEYSNDIEPWPFDPERAKKLLEEAGWVDRDKNGVRDKDGQEFRFELLFGNNLFEYELIATVFQEQAKEAGIVVTIRQLEWAVFLDRVKKQQYDGCMLAWRLGIEPDPYQIWHSSQIGGSNAVAFRNAEADQIMEEARLEFDHEKRIEMYHRFNQILHEEQPYTFLFSRNTLVAVDRRFQGIKLYPLGLDSREWWVPEPIQKYK